MKFLCTKVRKDWLRSPLNVNKVLKAGLIIKDPFIGIEILDSKPNAEQYNLVNNATEQLFGQNKKAFPIRLLDL